MFEIGQYYKRSNEEYIFKYNKTCWSKYSSSKYDSWVINQYPHNRIDTSGFLHCTKNGKFLTNQKENNMTDKNFSGKYSHIVKVKFSNSSTKYQYKTNIPNLIKGDHVVVDSSTGYGIAEVVEVFEDSFENAEKNLKAYAWVVQKVDMTEHKQRKEMHKKRKYILRKMKEKQEQVQEQQIYALLAKEDKEMASLLEDLTRIDG